MSCSRPDIGPPVPLLRIFDVAGALEFYCDYLGFRRDWEHRFEPDLPAYIQVSRSDVVLHLTEHYGDGSPNTVLWIPVGDVDALHAELIGRRHGYSRPGIENDAPGGPTMTVVDPFGNQLRFCQRAG
ncbi:bleomycin resistance protein [Mycobacterium kyorinense]|nr:glyoxalase superfamily protein [Mycobacterium kyorinense]OBI46096.1 bleomycin resistance protein [Mycobacterium kyorinense]